MAWLTVQEAADMLRVPVSWLYERTRTNSVPHVKLGKYLRFDRDELAAWVDELRRNGRGSGAVRRSPRSALSGVDFFRRLQYLLPPCNPDRSEGTGVASARKEALTWGLRVGLVQPREIRVDDPRGGHLCRTFVVNCSLLRSAPSRSGRG
jgi:excisionase family DNA binding protein